MNLCICIITAWLLAMMLFYGYNPDMISSLNLSYYIRSVSNRSNISNTALFTSLFTNQLNDVVESENILNGSDGINFIKSMHNALANEHVTCNPNQYKYMRLLLNEMVQFNILKRRTKTTSKDISKHSKHFSTWHMTYRQKGHKVRIQIINGSIYINHGTFELAWDANVAYRQALVIYLHELMLKYSVSLPNTDFVWHFHDIKIGERNKNIYIDRNWILNDTIPYFWSDVNTVYNNPYNNLFLFAPSRSYLKYRYYADYRNDTRYSKVITHWGGIGDYVEFKEVVNRSLLEFRNKNINKALFRGSSGRGHGIRQSLFNTLFMDDYIYNRITKSYFDVGDTNGGKGNSNYKYQRNIDGYPMTNNLTERKSFYMGTAQQLLYKYIIVLDGVSVRDSFFYLFQTGSVLLKQLSTYYEWWYYDLINNFHMIIFENIMDLIGIVVDLVDAVNGDIVDGSTHKGIKQNEFKFMLKKQLTKWDVNKLEEITKNAKEFADEYLVNDNNVDCFMIHMIQIYNHYLFDANSVIKPDNNMFEIKL